MPQHSYHHKLFKHHHTLSLVIILVLVAVALFFVVKTNFLLTSISEEIDPDIYQEIQLDNGKTYFGKVIKVDNSFISLADVYYLQSANNATLVKSSSEEAKLLNRDHVLSIEKLKNESSILKAIENYE